MIQNYKLKLNLKSAITYEHFTGRPYGDIAGVEDLIELAYCILVSNNYIDFTYEIFVKLLNQKKVATEITEAMNNLIQVNAQYIPRRKRQAQEGTETGEKGEIWMSDIANYLIVSCGIDPHYVLYELDLYELDSLIEACLDKKKGDLIEKRLFTFLEMSPLRLGKNIMGPEDILPFAWEADEKKKKQEEDLALQTKAVLGLFKKKEETNGEG